MTKELQIVTHCSCYQNMPIAQVLVPYVKSIEVESVCIEHPRIGLTPASYKIFPDLTVVMGIQYQGSLYLLENDYKKHLSHCGISGLQTKARVFQPANTQTKSILIRFYPWAINRIFQEAAYHFTDQALTLNDVVGDSAISSLEEQLATTAKLSILSKIVQNFLINLLAKSDKKVLPGSIISLAQQLTCYENIASITQYARECSLSQRSLERQFKSLLGLSPKKFLRLCQFQKTLHQLRLGKNWEYIVDQLNYYDQAHFINSFQEFSGFTPKQFVTYYALNKEMSYFSNT